MPGAVDSDVPMDPMGLLKSLVSPRGNHGSEDNAARSMYANQSCYALDGRTSNNTRGWEEEETGGEGANSSPRRRLLSVPQSGAVPPVEQRGDRGGGEADDDDGDEAAGGDEDGGDDGEEGGGVERKPRSRRRSIEEQLSEVGLGRPSAETKRSKARAAKERASQDGSEMDDDAGSSNLTDYKVSVRYVAEVAGSSNLTDYKVSVSVVSLLGWGAAMLSLKWGRPSLDISLFHGPFAL